MVYFENRAWKFLAQCEKLAGTWPYQKRTTSYALRTLSGSLLFLLGVTLVIRIVKEWNAHLHIVIENIIILFLTYAVITRLVSSCLAEKRRRKIFEQVGAHFETINDDDEAAILRKYSNQSLIFSIRYTVFLGSAAGLYDGLPIMRMYFSYFFGNGILEKKFPLFVDYLVDEKEYFFYILAHLFITLSLGMVVEFTFDMGFFLNVRHVCALFEIVKLRLARASEIFELCEENNQLSDKDEVKAYNIILTAVDLHNEALELTKLIDKSYRGTWFIILLLNTIIFAPLFALAILYKDDPFESFRRLLIFIMFLAHFYAIYLQGQMTLDYSSSVYDASYDFYWYNASKRSRVAILIMMTRSLTPCRLTGGNMFYLSMETYSMMLKTGLSYISLFAALDY